MKDDSAYSFGGWSRRDFSWRVWTDYSQRFRKTCHLWIFSRVCVRYSLFMFLIESPHSFRNEFWLESQLKGGLLTNFSMKYVFRRHFRRILSHEALKSSHRYQSYDNFGDFTCPAQPGHRATKPSVLCLRSPVWCIHSKETDDVIQNGGLVNLTN